jgi:hypothetical protein
MKTGRPQKPVAERLSVTLRLRVTEAEANRIHIEAVQRHVSVNQVLREKVFVERKVDKS